MDAQKKYKNKTLIVMIYVCITLMIGFVFSQNRDRWRRKFSDNFLLAGIVEITIEKGRTTSPGNDPGTMLAASGPEFCPERRGRIVKRWHGDPNQARSSVFGVQGGASASPAANVHFSGWRLGP